MGPPTNISNDKIHPAYSSILLRFPISPRFETVPVYPPLYTPEGHQPYPRQPYTPEGTTATPLRGTSPDALPAEHISHELFVVDVSLAVFLPRQQLLHFVVTQLLA